MFIGERKRVLILEDELLIAMELETLVQDYGCDVVGPASSCPAAIDLLKTQRVDAAILDLIVGDESCDQVADELDAVGVPWALSTGFDADMLTPRYKNVQVIAKPYSESQVRRMLTELLKAEAA